ncbi:transcriptional regulator, TetR family [Nonlabens sp. Hel1_33_55]|uniref:TetR/AcrR family transcriptional regulator n=1 Tax=Nonlabens sp. Hel1_33_55 TaxID=1336802 RepID=UPI000875DD88|nr:TetR/AcrR family transcriptional regulator [Nonlabens sp. Hel1_33_55]SCX93533.1 transcriptional regulator, TetR family [Nonlabens sp. Hel1_33_55]
MDTLLKNLKVEINEMIFLKDPESSDLGRRIVQHSIQMIHEMGFEQFTFRKLGKEIGSNESSIYRYFENKHKLLLYLTSWYWSWMEYQLIIKTMTIADPVARLETGVSILTREVVQDMNFGHVDEVTLSKIVVEEYSKSYLTKEVDEENKNGYFAIYKRLVLRLRDMITSVNPNYEYAASLSSTIIEGSLHQHFLKRHFKALTDCNQKVTPTDYFLNLIHLTVNPS